MAQFLFWVAIGLIGVAMTSVSSFLATDSWNKWRHPERKEKVIDKSTKINEVKGDYVARDKNIYYIAKDETSQKPLKQRIRDSLREINPVIITRIDNGALEMAVMINQTKLQKLISLQKDTAFNDYLVLQSTGSVSMGAHNTIGGHLNDVDDVGVLHGYKLIVKPTLKG